MMLALFDQWIEAQAILATTRRLDDNSEAGDGRRTVAKVWRCILRICGDGRMTLVTFDAHCGKAEGACYSVEPHVVPFLPVPSATESLGLRLALPNVPPQPVLVASHHKLRNSGCAQWLRLELRMKLATRKYGCPESPRSPRMLSRRGPAQPQTPPVSSASYSRLNSYGLCRSLISVAPP